MSRSIFTVLQGDFDYSGTVDVADLVTPTPTCHITAVASNEPGANQWAITGPLFQFSDTWQLVINTGTTIVTFLMVFLIQRTQNKDALAIHLKLNEIVSAIDGASNRLVDVEDLTEDEIAILHKHYQKLVAMAKHDTKLTQTHSIEEAEVRHQSKMGKRRRMIGGEP